MEEITNEMILKRLGWRVERDKNNNDDWLLYDPRGRSGRIYEDEEHALENAPDYINDLNHAITLTVPGTHLVLSTVDKRVWRGNWEACYEYILNDMIVTRHDDSPARAICRAWLAAMNAIEGGAE